MGRRVLLRLATVALLAVGGMAMIGPIVRQMTYPVPAVAVPSPPPPPLEEVWLEADGRRVSTWFLPPREPGAPLLLMLHGNGENLETMRWAGIFERFGELGTGMLAVDYPGYGRSEGSPGEAAIGAAAEAGWRWLAERPERGPRVVVGWSLGAAVGAQVAARHGGTVDGVILLSPWDSLAAVAAVHFPLLPVRAVLADRYDSVAAAAEIRAPSLLVHGDRDDIIPIRLGRALHAAFPPESRWLEVPGAGHNDLLSRQEVWQAMAELLARLERREPDAAAATEGETRHDRDDRAEE